MFLAVCSLRVCIFVDECRQFAFLLGTKLGFLYVDEEKSAMRSFSKRPREPSGEVARVRDVNRL